MTRLVLGFLVLGALPLAALDAPRPSLVFHQGHPVMAWVERQGAVTVGKVARWDGAWTSLGTVNRDPQRSVSSVALASAALATEGDLLVAAWGERPPRMEGKDQGAGPLHVGLWTDHGWTFPWPSPSRSTKTMADQPQVRLWQGLPWVVWAEDDARGQRLGLARWTGIEWATVEAPILRTTPP